MSTVAEMITTLADQGVRTIWGIVGDALNPVTDAIHADPLDAFLAVLAICGQVPVAEMGTDFFQEIDNDALFRDVALFSRTTTSPEQEPSLLEQAMQSALNGAP